MSRPLIADGAMGTALLVRKPDTDRPSSLNLLAPELVLELHRAYVAAGARLLVTNTLSATPDEALAGVRLAREAAGPAVSVAGSLAVDASHEVIGALAGSDLLIFETVTSIDALRAAVEAARQVSRQPIMASVSFERDGTLDGLEPAEVAAQLQRLGLAAFGYGCGFGLQAARSIMAELRPAAHNATLIAKPSLGVPRDGRYDVSPSETAAWAVDMAQLGVDIIGTCCGSTPEHTRAVAEALIDWEAREP